MEVSEGSSVDPVENSVTRFSLHVDLERVLEFITVSTDCFSDAEVKQSTLPTQKKILVKPARFRKPPARPFVLPFPAELTFT